MPAIRAIARTHGVREVWLFGSVCAPRKTGAPRDVDIALLGVPNSCWSTLERDLRRRFPSCRVEGATSYHPGWVSQQVVDDVPLHFIMATDAMIEKGHSIFRSIRVGECCHSPNYIAGATV